MSCGIIGKRRRKREDLENQPPVSCFPNGKVNKKHMSPFKKHCPLKGQSENMKFNKTCSIEDVVYEPVGPSRYDHQQYVNTTQYNTTQYNTTQCTVRRGEMSLNHTGAVSKCASQLQQDSGYCSHIVNHSQSIVSKGRIQFQENHLYDMPYQKAPTEAVLAKQNGQTQWFKYDLCEGVDIPRRCNSKDTLLGDQSKESSGFGTMNSLKQQSSFEQSSCLPEYASVNQGMMEEPSSGDSLYTAESELMLSNYQSYTCRQRLPANQESRKHRRQSCARGIVSKRSDQHQSLFGRGQLKLSIRVQHGLLTVHIVQGSQLRMQSQSSWNSFVQLNILPDDSKITRCRTETVCGTNKPLFDEKFSFEIVPEEDSRSRILISMWNRDHRGYCDMVGCMSFGLKHLTTSRKTVDGWYYLLPEKVGYRKHLQTARFKSHKYKAGSVDPDTTCDSITTSDLKTAVLRRGQGGYGFTVSGQSPAHVGRVNSGTPAYQAGLCPGDVIVKLNGKNVSQFSSTGIASMIRNATNVIVVDVQRSENGDVGESTAEETVLTESDVHRYNKEPATPTPKPPRTTRKHDLTFDLATPAPSPAMPCQAAETNFPTLSKRHFALEKLLLQEREYIAALHYGIDRYLSPLKGNLCDRDHEVLFQNMEKLSELTEEIESDLAEKFRSEELVNGDDFIGDTYKSKFALFCDLYQSYFQGLPLAEQALQKVSRSEHFLEFLEPVSDEEEEPLSIGGFLVLPVEHIKSLILHLQFVLSCTPPEHPDVTDLKVIVQGLEDCMCVVDKQDWSLLETTVAPTDTEGEEWASDYSVMSTTQHYL